MTWKVRWTSKATGTRDIQKLNEIGVFKLIGGGRSTAYIIQFLEEWTSQE